MALAKGSLSTKFLQSLLEVCAHKDITLNQLQQEAGFAIPDLSDEHGVISNDAYCELLESAAILCDDEHFGLHVGEAIKPGHYGVLGYACMSSNNLEDALKRALRYQTLVSDICLISIQQKDGHVAQKFNFPYHPFPSKHLAEENVVGVVSFARWIAGVQGFPIAVHFQHSAPKDISEHQRLLGCEILFDQEETLLLYPNDYLQTPLPQADNIMLQMMERYAEELLLKLPKSDSLIDKASAILADLLQSGEPSIEKLATAMSTNIRTLQRQLKAEDMNYQTLLDKVRQQLALIYINQDELSLTDIAFLLGFAEQSSFQRAFKRWTQQTPGRYRKENP